MNKKDFYGSSLCNLLVLYFFDFQKKQIFRISFHYHQPDTLFSHVPATHNRHL